jgi:hypothetical protein
MDAPPSEVTSETSRKKTISRVVVAESELEKSGIRSPAEKSAINQSIQRARNRRP